jgi:hypothetical protein
MGRMLFCGLSLLAMPPAFAAPWTFGEKITVAQTSKAKTFHHVESSGRKNIAVSGDTVGVIWEDNRSGVPQVYVAFKFIAAPAFEPEWRVSDAAPRAHTLPAYEPVIVALGAGRFLMGWEQNSGVWVRSGGPQGLDPAVQLGGVEAGQITLATGARGTHAAWAQRHGRHRQIVAAPLTLRGPNKAVRAGAVRPVDPAPPVDEQLYPTLAVTTKGVTVAWEDRRHGHTALLTSFAEPGKAFGSATELNEVVQKSATYGRGSGVTRATLAVFGADQVGAAWMDKRNFSTAYDIYGAISRDGGRRFGKNEIVQDSFGENFSQWHPAISGAADGTLAVAWDDDRDGSSDIQLSWKTAHGWSEDLAVPAASGAGQQTHPAIALDSRGDLHLLWLDYLEKGQPTRIFYALGKRTAGN